MGCNEKSIGPNREWNRWAGWVFPIFGKASAIPSNGWSTGSYIELPSIGNLDVDFEVVTNRIDIDGKTNEFIRLKIDAL